MMVGMVATGLSVVSLGRMSDGRRLVRCVWWTETIVYTYIW